MKSPFVRTSMAQHLLAGAVATAIAALATASAATSTKQNNTDNLDLPSSWDVLPGASDIALWDATVTGANSTLLGTNQSWSGVKVTNPGGTVTIGAGNTLRVGTAGLDLSSATQDLLIESGLSLYGRQSWKTAAGRTLGVSGTLNSNAGAVDFSNFSGTLGTIANTNDIIGPWATTGTKTSMNYVSATTGTVAATTTQIPATAADLSNVTSTTTNYNFGAAATTTGSIAANSLRYTGAAATLTNGANTITLNGLMNAGTGLLTVGTAATSGNVVVGSSGALHVTSTSQLTYTGALPNPIISLSSPITDGSAGASTVVFNGTNGTPTSGATGADLFYLGLNNGSGSVQGPYSTFTGGVVVASGILRIGPRANGALGASPSTTTITGQTVPVKVSVLRGAILRLDRNAIRGFLTLDGGTVWTSNSFGDTWAVVSSQGNVTLQSDSTFYTAGTGRFTINVPVVGSGGFKKTGTSLGTVVLAATNSYAGPTTINGGVLQLNKAEALYGGDTSKWIPANITLKPLNISPTGTLPAGDAAPMLRLPVGGATDFTSAQVSTLVTNLSTVNNNGFQAGAWLGLDSTNVGATGRVTVDANITDSTGPGGGEVNVRAFGVGTLELSGFNSYSGKTIIDGSNSVNAALMVSSLNSVVGGSPVSSLGHPVTVANGTIEFGSSNSNNYATLIYTGDGETTDRVIALVGQGGTNTIDQSGSGLLKFTSPVAMGTQTLGKVLQLQGSESGAGELAGAIGNPPSATTGITKVGTNTWTLSGINTYTGETKISAGTLRIGGAGQLSAGNYAGKIIIDGSFIYDSSANQTLSGELAGAGTFKKSSSGTLTLTGANTFTGETTVDGGILAVNGTSLSDSSKLTITTGKVAPTGTEVVDTLFFGTTPGSQAVLGTWGATGSGAAHIDDTHFSGTSGVVSVTSGPTLSAYELWAQNFGLSGADADPLADPDSDGLKNVIEFVFGSDPFPGNPTASSLELLPKFKPSEDPGNFVFTFRRKDASEGACTLIVQWSTDLNFAIVNDVPIGAVDSTTNEVIVSVSENSPDTETDVISVTIPATKAGTGGKLFMRIKAAVP